MVQQDQVLVGNDTRRLLSYPSDRVVQQDQVSFGNDTRRLLPYPSDRVYILDKWSGQLWSWRESLQTFMYLGQIFPIAGAGPIARIIQVPEAR
jgi:hypothetical protein